MKLYAVEKWNQSATGRTPVSRYIGVGLRAVTRKDVESRSEESLLLAGLERVGLRAVARKDQESRSEESLLRAGLE